MAEEQFYLINAQNQANQYLRQVDQAIASADPDELRQHLQQAMPFGQSVLESFQEALSMAEDPDTADRIEESMHHMDVSMEQGDQALEASEDEVMDFVAEMRKHAQQSMDYLAEAIGSAP